METININGVECVRADQITQKAEPLDGMPYCIVRGRDSGVFAGYIYSREGTECVIEHARRIWYWKGAASLSQLAQSGTSKPDECKFPEEVDSILVTDATEILDVTEKAKQSIAEVPVWKA